MADSRPLTSKEIDDGWCLEEAPADSDYESYELVVDERAPSSGFEEAYWRRCEGKDVPHGFGDGGDSVFSAKVAD